MLKITNEMAKPFHIAFFLPSLAGGGAQRVSLLLAQGFLQVNHIRVDLVLGEATGPFVKDIPPGVRLIDLGRSKMLQSILPLARYLRAERPDALVSALDYANVAAILAARLSGTGVPIAVVTHNHMSSALGRLRPWQRQVFKFLMRKTYPRAQAVVTVSRGVADDMAAIIGLPRTRIRVIYNPVIGMDLLNQADESYNHKWHNVGNPPVILAVGRLTAQKDFSTLIRAVALVRQQIPARLIILGEGELRSELMALVSALNLDDCVAMPGFMANPYSYMRRAAVVALSSRWEALPTVLIEALFCGVPVVSTDCPSGPREILAEGKYGRLVPVGDPAAMASALLDTLSRKPPAAPPQSWEPYLIENAVREYLNVFGHSLGHPAAAKN